MSHNDVNDLHLVSVRVRVKVRVRAGVRVRVRVRVRARVSTHCSTAQPLAATGTCVVQPIGHCHCIAVPCLALLQQPPSVASTAAQCSPQPPTPQHSTALSCHLCSADFWLPPLQHSAALSCYLCSAVHWWSPLQLDASLCCPLVQCSPSVATTAAQCSP